LRRQSVEIAYRRTLCQYAAGREYEKKCDFESLHKYSLVDVNGPYPGWAIRDAKTICPARECRVSQEAFLAADGIPAFPLHGIAGHAVSRHSFEIHADLIEPSAVDHNN